MSLKYGTNRFQVRVQDVSGQVGWTKSGTVVSLTVSTDTVAIGASSMVGTEKVRIVGILRLDHSSGNLAGIELTDGESLPVSAAGTARIRYNETLNRLEYSENGGAYTDLTGGWTEEATLLHPTDITKGVVVGAVAKSGTETLRQTGGAVLFDGTTGATPVSGAGTRFMTVPAKGMALRCGSVGGAQWDAANIGTSSTAFGDACQASGNYSTAGGSSATASGSTSVAIGSSVTASGSYSCAAGLRSVASLQGQYAMAAGRFVTTGDAQRSSVSLWRASTDAGSVELSLTGGAPAAGTRLTIASGKSFAFRLDLAVNCTAGTNVGTSGAWFFSGLLKNVGGTTTLVGCSLERSYVDAAIAASTVAITGDNANDCLAVTCAGIVGAAANTFHWHAAVYLSEVA